MELVIIKDPQLVVALDVGSTYSGYAWQWRSDFIKNRGNVQVNDNWESGSVKLNKTTSCILLEYVNEEPNRNESERNKPKPKEPDYNTIAKDYKVDSFGQKAERIYKNMTRDHPPPSKEIHGKFYFFRHFKRFFYGEKFNDKLEIEDILSQPLPLVVVMSKFIEALKDDFLRKHLTKGYDVSEENILWVVTVPSIWSPQARRLMRVAAEMAGIHHENLLLAKEPEAAVVHCLFLSEEERANLGNLGECGQIFMVADLGGLTVDLSVVKVRPNGSLEEVKCASGNLGGGQNVNDAFIQICYNIFQDNGWYEHYKKSLPSEWLEMEDDFENKKMQIGNDSRDERISLRVPVRMLAELSQQGSKLNDQCLTFDGNEMSFRSEFIRANLFEKSVTYVFDLLKGELQKVPECSTVVLVGGFAESSIVKQRIEEMIQQYFSHIKVVSPTSPFFAVMKGAVLFGHDPMIFESRKYNKTFGIKVVEKFDATIHNKYYMSKNKETDEMECNNIFHVHIKKGDSVMLMGNQPSCKYSPTYSNQKKIVVQIYSSEKIDPKYVTDPGCEIVDTIEVDMSNTKGGLYRQIEVKMLYGGTELSVKVTNLRTGKQYNAEYIWDRATLKFVCRLKQKPEEDQESSWRCLIG